MILSFLSINFIFVLIFLFNIDYIFSTSLNNIEPNEGVEQPEVEREENTRHVSPIHKGPP